MINTFHYKEDIPNGIRVDLVDLTLGKDGIGYYLSPKYRVETDRDVREIYIPKARINVKHHEIRVDHDPRSNNPVCDFGLGKLQMYVDDWGFVYRESVIEEKTKEMTLEEIEKKLGHKVKIVSREESND